MRDFLYYHKYTALTMCDCVPIALAPYSCNKNYNLVFTSCDWRKPRIRLRNNGFQFYDRATSGPNGVELRTLKSVNCVNASSRKPRVTRYEGYEDYDELVFKEKGEKRFEFETSQSEAEFEKLRKEKNGVDDDASSRIKEDGRSDEVLVSSRFKDEEGNMMTEGGLKDEDLVEMDDMNDVDSKLEELDQLNVKAGLRRRRQTMTRSSMLAKQVISIQSALNLGFVSQLWVDTSSWVVLIVEVKPNLLSGESEKFLLEDVTQVGDVVLVQDEGVMESEFRMVGLETLVGYNVVTPTRRSIGKVRGYTFNINSGAVESLELDSFGISIIPSALVSTYALFVEDVMEVLSDTVVVHEAAASRVQRLSKGFWGSQNVAASIDELGEYTDLERQPYKYPQDQRTERSSSRRKPRPKMRDVEDDWELPMDYL